MRLGGRIFPILCILQGQLLPHFFIEYVSYFTSYHPTAREMAGGIEVGATETCLIMYTIQLSFAALPGTNSAASIVIDAGKFLGLPFEFRFTIGDLIAFCTAILSMQFNYASFIAGY
jgi:hypothetical protein